MVVGQASSRRFPNLIEGTPSTFELMILNKKQVILRGSEKTSGGAVCQACLNQIALFWKIEAFSI